MLKSQSCRRRLQPVFRRLDSQEAAFEVKKGEHALATKALEQESAGREAAESSMQHKRNTVHKLTSSFNKLGLSNIEELSIDLPDNVRFGTLFHEWESMKFEVASLRNKLKSKTERQLTNYVEVTAKIVVAMICQLEAEEDGVRFLDASCLLCPSHLQSFDNCLLRPNYLQDFENCLLYNKDIQSFHHQDLDDCLLCN